jgi:hypothetical protein
MSKSLLTAALSIITLCASAQTKITSILTNDTWNAGGGSYVSNGVTYQWAQNPNNVSRKVVGFSSANSNYDLQTNVQGQIKLRRKNNAAINGDYNLVFTEGYAAGSLNSMSTPMPNNMEIYLGDNGYNKGAENLFDNTGNNKNNIERLDWISTNGISVADNTKFGFVVMQKGNDGDYMPVNMAAITAIDASGNPTAYGPVVNINDLQWENIFNSSFSNRVNKATAGNQLLNAGGGTHSRAGNYVTLAQLGINSNVTTYGYSIFGADLPITNSATNLVSIADNNAFPPTSCCYCGFDFLAVTGLFKEAESLPLAIQSFVGNKIDGNKNAISFTTNNYFNQMKSIELMKSYDGITYYTCKEFAPNFSNNYNFIDEKLGATIKTYYRIKINKLAGAPIVSGILKINNDRDVTNFELVSNPVKSNVTFAYKSTTSTKLQANIVDLYGKTISTNAVTIQTGTNLVSLNSSSTLANGIYLLQIYKNGALESSIRFMKQ